MSIIGKDMLVDSSCVLYLTDRRKDATTWTDLSGSGNNGTVYGAATPPAASVARLGYLFDGVDDYVDAGNGASLNITGAITLEAWVMIKGTGTGSFPMIVGKDLLSSIYPYALRADANGFFVFASYNTAVLFSVSTAIPANNIWYHVVGTFDKTLDSANAKIYLNGVQKDSRTYTLPLPTNAGTVKIGRYYINYFNGSIDKVRIYNRALSAGEILALYGKTRKYFGV